MTTTADRLRELVAPVVSDLGLSLYDIEHSGGTVRVFIDGEGGIDLAAVTAATRRISSQLDEADFIPSSYTLEVSSPGIERHLRTDDQFEGAVGERVKLKMKSRFEGDRRIEGELVEVQGHRVSLKSDEGGQVTVAIDEIDRARTQFVDSAAPKPGKGSKPGQLPRSKQPTPKAERSGGPAAGSNRSSSTAEETK